LEVGLGHAVVGRCFLGIEWDEPEATVLERGAIGALLRAQRAEAFVRSEARCQGVGMDDAEAQRARKRHVVLA
jgi:hypothetical protein